MFVVLLQVKFAFVMAFIYAIIQILSAIGVIYSIAKSDPVYCNPNAIFLFLVLASFGLCGVLHPLEILTLLNGIVYYMFVPTMCMILMLYAICNINCVSWGTRETQQSNDDESAVTQDITDMKFSCFSTRGSYDFEEARQRTVEAAVAGEWSITCIKFDHGFVLKKNFGYVLHM